MAIAVCVYGLHEVFLIFDVWVHQAASSLFRSSSARAYTPNFIRPKKYGSLARHVAPDECSQLALYFRSTGCGGDGALFCQDCMFPFLPIPSHPIIPSHHPIHTHKQTQIRSSSIYLLTYRACVCSVVGAKTREKAGALLFSQLAAIESLHIRRAFAVSFHRTQVPRKKSRFGNQIFLV